MEGAWLWCATSFLLIKTDKIMGGKGCCVCTITSCQYIGLKRCMQGDVLAVLDNLLEQQEQEDAEVGPVRTLGHMSIGLFCCVTIGLFCCVTIPEASTCL